MFLRKVEISGFKSFAQKTVLEFLPTCSFNGTQREKGNCGITAVVGPNGSGKSNVADAIRWAMGEQSMKNLRGKKLEDIIFAGSGKKARLGAAGVTLHFDNSDKRIPLDFSEVAISRKIFRSGESEYQINGSRVRLIDVVDLLAKAGIGRESYCVINQGMSDAVLNATSAERRIVLEDAAGVKQYQIKKERSVKKLDSTRENLERVGDLIKEIEPHLRMLKRQSEKAQKGKEVEKDLREKQNRLFSFLWFNFQNEKEKYSQEKNNLGIKMMNVQREADKINDEINRESKEVQDFSEQEKLERKRKDILMEINSLEKELVINEGRVEIEKERLAAHPVMESLPVDLKYVQEKIAKIRASQEKLISRISSVETLEELQDIKEFARAIQQELYDLFQEVNKGEVKIEMKSPEKNGFGEKIKELDKKSEHLRVQLKEKGLILENINKEISDEIRKNQELRSRFFELERALRQKQDELGGLKDQFNESKIELAKIDVREEDLKSEIKSELKIDPEGLQSIEGDVDKEELEREISRLKIKMEQIGRIDPLIIEEYEETRKRFEFLTNESEDLKKAIDSLKQVIKEMDEKIKDVFDKAFEEINEEFSKYFRIIFGGGNAHLTKSKIKNQKSRMKKEEDIMPESEEGEINGEGLSEEEEKDEKEEVGVDIFACPPGKKITNLSMLSGGERSLTSIALLFAIISHNPPPFAILDEVEAALDEANSRRFGRILQELSSDTQFVIITHNRETMRQASLLYGVTMGEDGISKLLSVRLDQVGKNGKIEK